jgi:hypothetical protein
MHLVQGILASNPDARMIQFTLSVCGPFFNLAPIIPPSYPVKWSQKCLGFTEQVREWLKANDSVRYAVLSSPFFQYLHNEVLLQNGDRQVFDSRSLASEFEKTLVDLLDMGITPVIFSPMPSSGHDLGRCLVRATWFEVDLDECNFHEVSIAENQLVAFDFLGLLEEEYTVVRLDRLICNDGICQTHLNSTFLYRDGGHLSYEGSAALGKRADFYKIITGSSSD